MKFNPIAKTSVPFLKRSLDAYAARQRAIAENMSNVETKGYRRIKVSFEDQLQEAVNRKRPQGLRADPRHMVVGGATADVHARIITQNRPVNMETEMAELAKNQIRFEFVSRMLHGSYTTLREAIQGRFR